MEPSRTSVVTGAGRGIGAAIARHLSAHGHRVALTARTQSELDATASTLVGPTMVVAADLTNGDDVDRLFSLVENEWGPVEILAANAGVARSAPLARTDDELWDLHINVNLTAAFRCVRRTVPRMVSNDWGRVIVTGSTTSRAGAPYVSAYAASKHGLLGLVRAVAAEVAGSGVTINAVCPGFVDTDLTDTSVANIAAATGATEETARDRLAHMQGHGQFITSDEVARAVLYLACEGSINGQSLVIDGGTLLS
ncbi:MAG: SDR family NAD(P)-dependent oxidoreductase [Acidimicrobiia bacterium]